MITQETKTDRRAFSVSEGELPPLPEEAARATKGETAFFVKWSESGKELRGPMFLFTAEQYREGQRQAYAIGRGAAVRDYVSLQDAATKAAAPEKAQAGEAGAAPAHPGEGKEGSEVRTATGCGSSPAQNCNRGE